MTEKNIPNRTLFIVLKNRWLIVRLLLIIMVPTIIITTIIPKKYTVTTILMPPENQTMPSMSLAGLSMGDFAGFFSGGMGYSLPLMTTLSDVYHEILNSRTLVDNVIISTGYMEEVDLQDRYLREPPTALYLARRIFRRNYLVEVTPSGFIRIEVTTKDPLYSVEISDRIVFLLDSINQHVNTSRLEMNLRLLQSQVASANTSLAEAEHALLVFEDTTGVVELETETAELVAILMEAKGRYLELQASAQAIREGLARGSNAMLIQLEREASATREVIDLIETGDLPSFGDDAGFSFALMDIPDLAVEYARLRSDYEISLQMASMLQVQLEQTVVQASMSEETIRLLDEPEHPGWKSKPKRLFIWIEVFLLALFFLCCYLLARDRMQRMKQQDPEGWQPWGALFRDIRNDFRRKKLPRS